MNCITSTNIVQQSDNEQNDHDINQISSSNHEKDLNPLSIASPVSMPQRNSPMMFQNETTSSFTTEEPSNNTNSPETNTIYASNKSSSAKQSEDKPLTSKEGKERRSVIKQKREQYQS